MLVRSVGYFGYRNSVLFATVVLLISLLCYKGFQRLEIRKFSIYWLVVSTGSFDNWVKMISTFVFHLVHRHFSNVFPFNVIRNP